MSLCNSINLRSGKMYICVWIETAKSVAVPAAVITGVSFFFDFLSRAPITILGAQVCFQHLLNTQIF
jgi:hypothetical protein